MVRFSVVLGVLLVWVVLWCRVRYSIRMLMLIEMGLKRFLMSVGFGWIRKVFSMMFVSRVGVSFRVSL